VINETEMPRVGADWLRLRAAADAAARSAELADLVRDRLARAGRPLVVHDLGCGTGSMGRWLAPRLGGPQHWVLHDRDPDLLALAARDVHGPGVTVEARPGDATAAEFTGASLVTCSALLDLLTAPEVERIAAACAAAKVPALFTLSVSGRSQLSPADPLDRKIQAAFNAHQRRTVAGRWLLGPDAVAVTVAAFDQLGARTVVRPSPWRLGPADGALTAQWFDGWLGAAVEQEPGLPVVEYARWRRLQLTDGKIHAVLEHDDILACFE
jgi:hypothetical protein